MTGHRLGTPAEIAAAATWRPATVSRYGRRDTVEITVIDAIWYGAFGNTEGRTVLVREPGRDKVMAIFTTDTTSDTETVVARYADRWPIEVAIAGGKQLLGIGQARNRLQRAVERTVPLSFCVYRLVVVWYTLHGYHPDDLTGRRADQPWYSHKDDIAFEDMLATLRRSLVAARITDVDAAQPDPRKYRDYELACAAVAYSACSSADVISEPHASQNRAPSRGSEPHVRHAVAAVIAPSQHGHAPGSGSGMSAGIRLAVSVGVFLPAVDRDDRPDRAHRQAHRRGPGEASEPSEWMGMRHTDSSRGTPRPSG